MNRLRLGLTVIAAGFFISAVALFATGWESQRAEAGEQGNPSVSLVKDEALGNHSPEGDVVFNLTPTTHDVSVVITGPGDTDLELSILGPTSCDPKWVSPLDTHPTMIGDIQTSIVNRSNIGPGTLTATYSISCTDPGSYSLQIVANVSSESAPGDPEPYDNQDENTVQVTVEDGDQCLGVNEDFDGRQDNDGCPDTDVGVNIVKEEQLVIQPGIDSTHLMSITVTNGNYPASVRLTLLAVSKIGICKVKLVKVGADQYAEFETDEDGIGGNDTFFSQIEITINGMAAGQVVILQRSYVLNCQASGPLVNAFEIQADVLPLPPVKEENLGNAPPCPSPWCVPAVVGGPASASDNVHKNFPDIVTNTPTPSTSPSPTATPTSSPTPTPTPTPTASASPTPTQDVETQTPFSMTPTPTPTPTPTTTPSPTPTLSPTPTATPMEDCPDCDDTVITVDEDVSVDFNPVVQGGSPICDDGNTPDLCNYFTWNASGPTPDTWIAIFEVGRSKLIIKDNATVSTVTVPTTSNNRKAPGIVIHGSCELIIEGDIDGNGEPGGIVVNSVNQPAGDILIQFEGNITINGYVRNEVSGTLGLPGEITIASCCGDIVTGPKSRIETIGVDPGGSDITIVTCCSRGYDGAGGDIVINGLVRASHKFGQTPTINIAAIFGAVTIDGRNDFGTETVSGTLVRRTSGVLIETLNATSAGDINIQAENDITVFGNHILNALQLQHGAVAVSPHSTNGNGGSGTITAISVHGSIIATDRAFDFENQFNSLNAITLKAGQNINLSVTATMNDGSASTTKAVVSTQGGSGGQGGTNTLRAYSGGISIGAGAQVLAGAPGGAPGTNLLTSCTGVSNSGVVNPADANNADDLNACSPPAPTPLFTDCSQLGVMFPMAELPVLGNVNCDDIINVLDVTSVLKFAVSGDDPTACMLANGDANQDGTIDGLDALWMLQYQSGVSTSPEVEVQ